MLLKIVSIFIPALLIFLSPVSGEMLYSMDAADSTLLGNSFVDILFADDIVWLAGGKGLAAYDVITDTWVTYTSDDLNSDNPSAIFSRPGQIWVAGSHTEQYDGINYPFGDGFNVTTDNGHTWASYIPSEATNFGQLVYDITGNDSSTYAACFHGGLIVSHDFGTSWQHIFYTQADSAEWAADQWADSASGRFYACRIDTLHNDTLILLAGSAKGLMKFLYLPKRVKLGGNLIGDILGVDSTLYVAHEGGVTRTIDSIITPRFTADTINGLGANWVRKLANFGDKIWAGVFNPEDTSGVGLYYSSDSAESWSRTPVDFFSGQHSGVFQFKIYFDSAVYIAAGDSGIYRSIDFGLTWEKFFIDSSQMGMDLPQNQVYSIDLTADTIYLGTKAGLVRAPYTNYPFIIDADNDTIITFPENENSGSFVSLVRHSDGEITTQDQGTFHYSYTWVGVEPQTDSGAAAGIVIDSLGRDSIAIYARVNDILIIDPISAAIATEYGLTLSSSGLEQFPSFNFSVVDPTTGLTLNNFEFLTADMVGERLYTGSSMGFAYSVNSTNWRVFRANTDPRKRDLGVVRTHQNSGLPGDWVVAIDLQVASEDTILWAACRSVPDTAEQKTALGLSTDFGDSWTEILTYKRVWNMAFNGDTAFACASEGLYFAESPWTNWTRMDIIDVSTQDTLAAETEIYSAEVVGDTLWVVTELGIAKHPLGESGKWNIERNYKATEAEDEVFAAPVPYSPINSNGRLTVHYYVENTAGVTVEIYDFAMNLVKVLAENKTRIGGADYFESWDGKNAEGDMVATGIYYIRVTHSTGEENWGRLAIIP